MRILVSLITLFLLSSSVMAQVVACEPSAKIITEITGGDRLEQQVIDLYGPGPEKFTLRIYLNVKTKTWTILGLPNVMMACVMATGKGYKLLTSKTDL